MGKDYRAWKILQTTAEGFPSNLVGYTLVRLVKFMALTNRRSPNGVKTEGVEVGYHLDGGGFPIRIERPQMLRWQMP